MIIIRRIHLLEMLCQLIKNHTIFNSCRLLTRIVLPTSNNDINIFRFYMAGVKAVSTIGVVRGIRVMSGSLINQSRMTYTQL
jgi:hypothetical protein